VTPGERVPRALYAASVASLVTLIVLCLAWELWLAPLRPGGSWLALKVVPLLGAVPGVLKARLYTLRWAMMLVLAYFTEGVVRAYAEHGTIALLATIEIILSLTFYAAAICYVRIVRAAPQ
jgi:uncharacterized membrane protein